MDVKEQLEAFTEIQILAAAVVLLYEDHLKDDGHIVTAVNLARGVRLLKEVIDEDALQMCLDFKNSAPKPPKRIPNGQA